MARKKWISQTEITPALLKFREKRKWQIALRRYVLERNPCFDYAPYFGLDIENMRQWFECQFQEGTGWGDFSKKWQFDHIIPVTYFNFSIENELKMCWNFTNIRVEEFQRNKDRGYRLDVLGAKNYFKKLHEKTNYPACLKMLQKINEIEISELASTENLQAFILEHREYLDMIENYTPFEFELLNSGRNINEVKKEMQFLKKYGK
jgi:hypothetical protein